MKSRPKNKGKKFIPHQKKRKISSVSPEIIFAQKLAANDPVNRNRAVKKLQKWLKVRSDQLSRDEIMKIWKGLHYCFWMSDKPLVQEELAETIGQLIHCFSTDSDNALIFVECGLITEGREWVGIDQWRMDKFMMLMRRLLRHIFNFLIKSNWSKTDQVNKIFSKSVVSNNAATLGFRLHFTDIFLEELAKVGGEDLDEKVIVSLLEPFTQEIAKGEDDRLADHINERIYEHLMRQSDIGIASEEALDGGLESEDEEDDETENLGSDDEEAELAMQNTAQDPRAGNVSVTLSQLKVDFEKLSEILFAAGNAEEISTKRRGILYDLTKKFKDLAKDVYPLIPDLSEEEAKIPKLKLAKEAKRRAKEELEIQDKIRLEKDQFKQFLKRKHRDLEEESVENGIHSDDATNESNQDLDSDKEFAESEDDMIEPPKKISKAEKNDRSPKKSKKGKAFVQNEETNAQAKLDSVSETPLKKKKKKSNENLTNETENWQISPKKKVKKTVEQKGDDKLDNASIESISTKVKKDKKKKKKNQQNGSPESMDTSDLKSDEKPAEIADESVTESPLTKKNKKKNKKDKIDLESNGSLESLESEIPTETPKKSKKKKSKDATEKSEQKLFGEEDDWNPQEASIFATTPTTKGQKSAVFLKKSKSAETKVKGKKDHINLLADKKRRISFALSQNRFQDFNGIDRSMQESPDIPYVPERTPKQGVLKTKSANNTPNAVPTSKAALQYNTMMNGKSKAAKRLGLNQRFFQF